MNPLSSPRWQIVLGACTCAAVGAGVSTISPESGLYPQCLLYQATGIYCAGCGATRAVRALVHGHVLQALHDNLLFVSLLPVALFLVARYLARAWRADRWPPVRCTERGLLQRGLGGLAVMLLFMAVRNLPGAEFDWLRPLAA